MLKNKLRFNVKPGNEVKVLYAIYGAGLIAGATLLVVDAKKYMK